MSLQHAIKKEEGPQQNALHRARKPPQTGRAANDLRDHPRGFRALSNHGVLHLNHGAIQAKLSVGAPNDSFEQEADCVAEQVMREPDAASPVTVQPSIHAQVPEEGQAAQTKPLAATITPLVQRASVDSAGSFEPAAHFEAGLSTGGGMPLPTSTRSFMEPRFGADFSDVRLHTGGEAARLNRCIHARAFTAGNHIYLGEGKDALDSGAGKHLLAHELAHTIQQGAAVGQVANPANSQNRLVQRNDDGSNVRNLDQEYETAVRIPDWQAAAEWLNAFNREDILRRLGHLSLKKCESLHQGALDNPRLGPDSQVAQLSIIGPPRPPSPSPAPPSPVSAPPAAPAAQPVNVPMTNDSASGQSPATDSNVANLESQYKAAVEAGRKTGRWEEAAEKLNGFNREDILDRLQYLKRGEIASLHSVAKDDEKLGPESQVALLTRAAYLDINYENEKNKGNWVGAAQYLNGFNDDDILARVKNLSTDEQRDLYAGAATFDWLGRITKAFDIVNPEVAANAKMRADVQDTLAIDIASQWKTKKETFVAVASDPKNTLTGHQLFQIWFSFWIEKLNAAADDEKRIRRKVWSAGQVAYAENMDLFQHGKRDALGTEYEEAVDRYDAANFYLNSQTMLMNWLEDWVDSARHHVTFKRVNEKALEIAKAMQRFETWFAPFIFGALGVAGTRSGTTVASPKGGVKAGALGEVGAVEAEAAVAKNVNLKPNAPPGRVVYPRGAGAAEGPVPNGYTPVARWVDKAEADRWIANGGTYIPPDIGKGSDFRVYVTTPGAPRPATAGPVRIDFWVQGKALQKAGTSEWRVIFQPVTHMPIHNVSIHYPE